MKQVIATHISQIVKDVFDVEVAIELTRPDEQFGDYSTNVSLQLAGKVGKNPREIGEALAAELRKDSRYSKVDVAGPGFVNITVPASSLFASLKSHIDAATSQGLAYGASQTGKGKVAVVEFPSPNMAKPYSVGHMRPANQGWAMKQLLEATGWQVITDNHLGDYGTPFGKWVVGFLKYSSQEALAQKGIYELARVYIDITQALKAEKEAGETALADEVQSWLLRLEQHDEQALAYSKQFNELSLAHMHHVMSRLEISTQYELGEAFFAPMGKQIITELLAHGIAQQNDDGSIIAPLDDQGIDVPILLQKSNGAALYATSDLATLRYRETHWHPQRVLYHVGAEQQFHFRQVFALARKMDISTELIHVSHGMIDQLTDDGTREKMSSRKGVVLMEELLDRAEATARQMVKGDGLAEDDIRAIALGTIKFTDFAQDRKMGMLFDWDTMFSLTGRSGPFVQYAAVRINKILHDFDGANAQPAPDYQWDAERGVILQLLGYPELVERAAHDCEAHLVASYVYDLAKLMNRYYEHTQIATEGVSSAERQSRLYLLSVVSGVMSHALSLLGIRVPAKM